ncbi:MAG: zf-HC2 domain-containing protein [Egibacteraceae bacterium]
MRDRCEDVEPLCSAWLDDTLDQSDRAGVDAHLQRCAACRDEVDSLRRVRDLLGNLPVRRLPSDLSLLPAPPGPGGRGAPRVPVTAWSGGQRAVAGVAVALGLVGGAAFALGGQPAPGARVVSVPVDRYVSDHLVHTVGDPTATPVFLDGRR